MANLLREDYFVCTDINRNANKFWHIREFDDSRVVTRYGRVGVSETETPKSFPSQAAATRFYDGKIKEKLKPKGHRDSYSKVEIVTAAHSSPVGNLASVAERDIEVDCETTRELVRWLTKINTHNILTSTTMTYNEAEGTFRTPLGIVSKAMVDRARVLLNEITPYVEHKKLDDSGLTRLVNEYFRLVPQNLGGTQRKIKIDSIFTVENIKKQADILDALEASVNSVLTNPKTGAKVNPEEGRVFNVKLHGIDDGDQIESVKKMFNHTRQGQHVSNSFNFKKLYSIDLPRMREAWEQDGAKLGNRMRLWHGTKPPNILSILKSGLIIPSSAAHGRAYGDGVYFSDQSTKSLNYACGYWSGGDQGNRIFMFLADVGMGKYYVPKSSFRGTVPEGYDSCFAEAGKSGVQNHEMIVYATSRFNLVYLVEFER